MRSQTCRLVAQALSRSAALWLQAGRPAAAIEALETLERSCKLKPGERQELAARLARCAVSFRRPRMTAVAIHIIRLERPREPSLNSSQAPTEGPGALWPFTSGRAGLRMMVLRGIPHAAQQRQLNMVQCPVSDVAAV